MNYKEQIKELLKNPEKLKMKKPFTRGIDSDNLCCSINASEVGVGEKVGVEAPGFKRIVVDQSQFLKELDPYCHDVLFNDNLPSICVKVRNRGYREIKFERVTVPIQKLIKGVQLIYLTAHKMQFTLDELNPDETQKDNFIEIKQMWEKRNQDGMRNKMVDKQMTCGDAGLLYYFDRYGRIKSRILSYDEGFVLCPHNDENGDRILESVYYVDENVEHIDSYDDKYIYRYVNKISTDPNEESGGWQMMKPVPHGFEEIPLITKRGDVPWNEVQSNIELYEEQYNIFNAIQRRFGWGVFYVKGKFKDEGKKIAGNVVLNDSSPEGKGDAKFLTPPKPENMIEYLKQLLSTIQLGSQTTFVLPEDIKMTGDVSGLAVQVTKELDIQKAMQNVIDWQNVADKMLRLFMYGLAKELVNTKKNKKAITEFQKLNITAKFKVWRPFNEYEFNSMLATLCGANILSRESGTELNTVSKPDELSRMNRQEKADEEKLMKKQEMAMKQAQIKKQPNGDGTQNKPPKSNIKDK